MCGKINRQAPLRLAAAVVLLLALLTACTSKAARAQEKMDLGQKYLTELNYTEAVASFTEAIELDPENIPAYMGRAEAYVGLEQYPEAKADYTTAIEKAAELPYTQAQAYVGRAEVNELTTANEDALSDYEAASTALDKVDVEKITDVTEQMLEALKIKVYNACARLSALFGKNDAAVAGYTKALDSLAKLPDDTDVLDVKATKVTSYTGRADANTKLEHYADVLPDYDALIELGEDKAADRDTLLAALSLAKSQAGDLAGADSWLGEVNHADYAESVQLTNAENILKQAAELAKADGTKAYDKIKAALTTDEAKAAMQNVLARGYQLRYYDADGKMLAVYANTTAWDDVNAEENGTVDADAVAAVSAPTAEEINNVSLSKLYVYYGAAEGRSREGEGLWYILNPAKTELTAETYTWKNDQPEGGFQQKAAAAATTAPAAESSAPAAAAASGAKQVKASAAEPKNLYTLNSAFTVSGQNVQCTTTVDPTAADPAMQEQVRAALALTGLTGYKGTFHFSQPVQGILRENNRTVVLVPAGTTMTVTWNILNQDGTVGQTFNSLVVLDASNKYSGSVQQVTVQAGQSVGPCMAKLYGPASGSVGEAFVSTISVIVRAAG